MALAGFVVDNRADVIGVSESLAAPGKDGPVEASVGLRAVTRTACTKPARVYNQRALQLERHL